MADRAGEQSPTKISTAPCQGLTALIGADVDSLTPPCVGLCCLQGRPLKITVTRRKTRRTPSRCSISQYKSCGGPETQERGHRRPIARCKGHSFRQSAASPCNRPIPLTDCCHTPDYDPVRIVVQHHLPREDNMLCSSFLFCRRITVSTEWRSPNGQGAIVPAKSQ